LFTSGTSRYQQGETQRRVCYAYPPSSLSVWGGGVPLRTASQQREPPAERLPLEEPYAQIRQHQQPQHMLRMLQATGCNMQQDTVVPTPAKKVQGPGERRVSARAGPGRGEQGVTAGDRGRNSVSSRREPKNVKCCMCLGCCLLLLQRSVRLFGMCYY
jgi:hypothetical protein